VIAAALAATMQVNSLSRFSVGLALDEFIGCSSPQNLMLDS